MIWNPREHIAGEVGTGTEVRPSLKTPAVEEVTVDKLAIAKQVGVLIDGGASHNVYYSATIPEGAIEKELELAHGSKKGYIINDDIIFLDDTMSLGQGAIASIISLGRLVSYGAKMRWEREGAYLTMPNGKL